MFGDKTPQVLIAGAGPVGLFTALCLARRGVGVKIVDTGVWACTHSYALALHPRAVRLLAELGLAERVLGSAYLVKQWNLADHTGVRKSVALAQGEDDGAIAVLRQDVFESMLERALNELGVKVDWRQELTKLALGVDNVRATISRYEKESRGYIVAHTEWVISGASDLDVGYVIGADGYNSRVRRAMGVDFAEVGPAEYYAVFEFACSRDLKQQMTMTLGNGACDTLWPLPGGDARWSFRLPGYHDSSAETIKDALDRSGFGNVPTERLKDRTLRSDGDHAEELSTARLHQLIADRAPWFDASSIGEIKWRTVVRFERRMASSFGAGRLWLAGDSAHLTGPAGIQSMNAGLIEGYDLATALASVLRDGASTSLLSGAAQRAMACWHQLHGRDGELRAQANCAPLVAAHTGELLSCIPATGAELGAMARELGLAYAAHGTA